MLSNWWLTALSCVELSAMALALILVVRRPKLWAQWPSCCTYILVEFCTGMLLMTWLSDTHRYKNYFYTYWISRGVLSVIRLWVIIDVLRSFPGLDFLPRSVYLGVGTAGLTIVSASAAYAFHVDAKLGMQVKDTVTLINQSVAIGWGTFAVALILAIRLFNIGWEPRGAGVAYCLFVRIVIELVVSSMFVTHNRSIRICANVLDTLCSIGLYISWSYLLLRPRQFHDRRLEEESAITIHRSVTTLLALSSSRERLKS
jgi:hypothetical protein